MNLPAFVTVLALSLSACAIPAERLNEPLATPDVLMGSRWLAQGIVPPHAPARTVPQLRFVSPTQVAGSGGCNSFSGPLSTTGTVWQIGPLASTRKFCMGPEMETEKHFLASLERVRSATLSEGVLALKDAAGGVLLRLTRSE